MATRKLKPQDRKLLCQIAARLYAVDLADDLKVEDEPAFSTEKVMNRALRAISAAVLLMEEVDVAIKEDNAPSGAAKARRKSAAKPEQVEAA